MEEETKTGGEGLWLKHYQLFLNGVSGKLDLKDLEKTVLESFPPNSTKEEDKARLAELVSLVGTGVKSEQSQTYQRILKMLESKGVLQKKTLLETLGDEQMIGFYDKDFVRKLNQTRSRNL